MTVFKPWTVRPCPEYTPLTENDILREGDEWTIEGEDWMPLVASLYGVRFGDLPNDHPISLAPLLYRRPKTHLIANVVATFSQKE